MAYIKGDGTTSDEIRIGGQPIPFDKKVGQRKFGTMLAGTLLSLSAVAVALPASTYDGTLSLPSQMALLC